MIKHVASGQDLLLKSSRAEKVRDTLAFRNVDDQVLG